MFFISFFNLYICFFLNTFDLLPPQRQTRPFDDLSGPKRKELLKLAISHSYSDIIMNKIADSINNRTQGLWESQLG